MESLGRAYSCLASINVTVEVCWDAGGGVNPLTTDDECIRHDTLAACYQLAQSVLKISFALAKKVG